VDGFDMLGSRSVALDAEWVVSRKLGLRFVMPGAEWVEFYKQ
jgi:hypothetical protein